MTSHNQNDRRAIVCGISADHAFALAALIVGVSRHNPDFKGDFVVFHDGLSAQQKKDLSQLWPQIHFRPYGLDTVTARFGRGPALAVLTAMYSPLILAKFEIPDLLLDYDKCLWLDVDILVQGDFSAAWDFNGFAWRPLPNGAFGRRTEVMSAFADMRRDGVPLLNGGVVGMGQGLRGRVTPADLYAMAARILDAVGAHAVDELALFFITCERDLPLHQLDKRFNHPVVAPGGREAVLLHAIGPDKFWNSSPLQLAYPEWAQNAGEWRFDGPSRLANAQAMTPDAALKAARNRSFWLWVYDTLRADLPYRLRPDLRTDDAMLRLFIAGLPDAVHLRLIRQKTERRLGVELCFPDDETSVAALADRLGSVRSAKRKSLDASRHGKVWTYAVVVPMAETAAMLKQIMDAIEAG